MAFAIYLAFWLLVFARPLLGHLREFRPAADVDASLYMWYLKWWPYALTHRIDPLFAAVLWVPYGINLAWATPVPLFSLLAWPITAALGPIASLNVMCILAPPLAGWAAFLLCRQLSGSWWPALLGGCLFGFSSPILAEECTGDLHVTLVFLVPLAVLAIIRAIEGRTPPGRFTVLLAAILAAQFLTAIEIFATLTMFGAIALALAWLFFPAETARRIGRIAPSIALAYAIAAVVVSPYLYWLFAHGMPHGQIYSAETYSANLLGFALPSQIDQIGALLPALYLSRFLVLRNAAYLGLPMLAIAAVFGWRQWRTPAGKLLLSSFVIVTVFALGPRLHIAYSGRALIPLPGLMLSALPLIDKALPGRFVMYSALCLAAIGASWFASNRLGLAANLAIAAIVVLFAMPSFSFPWVQADRSPAVFTSGAFRDYLKPHETVLVLPFGWRGDSMLWQAETNMYFKMTGGWTGLFPKQYKEWPIFHAFVFSAYLPDASEQLGAFLAHFHVDAAVVADSEPDARAWGTLLAKFSGGGKRVSGAAIYRMNPAALAPFRDADSATMRKRAADAAINSLILAAGDWLAAGRSLTRLDPAAALESGALKESWCAGEVTDPATGNPIPLVSAAHHWFCGAAIGGTPHGDAIIGIPGVYADLAPVIDRYRNAARHIYFPFGRDLLNPRVPAPRPGDRAFLEMEFAPAQIAAIAAQLGIPSTTLDRTK
ncbi:MAG: hypothetical protein ACREQI_03525 [Candidatus Binataceae bacterium]